MNAYIDYAPQGTSDKDAATYFTITQGTLTVTYKEQVYNLSFEGKTAHGLQVKMRYAGDLNYKMDL